MSQHPESDEPVSSLDPAPEDAAVLDPVAPADVDAPDAAQDEVADGEAASLEGVRPLEPTSDAPAEGDDSAPEGDDAAPEGDGSAPEGDGSAPEGDDAAPEGDDEAPMGREEAAVPPSPPTDGGDDSAPEGDNRAAGADDASPEREDTAPTADDMDPSGDDSAVAEGGEEDASLPGEDDEEGPGLERSLHLPPERRKSVIESLIFVADQPISERQIAQRLGLKPSDVRPLVEELIADYEEQERGIRIDRISGGLQFRTAVENAPFVREMMAPKPVRLTRAQLETLSIVAYRQPVTRPEIDDIRGVDSGAALKVLADRDLIRILGRKEEPGRPLLYGTTTHFLEFFGLDSIRDLPTLKEFSELTEESRALFERRMGEPLDLKSIAEEAKAAEEAMQDVVLSDDPEELGGEGEGEDGLDHDPELPEGALTEEAETPEAPVEGEAPSMDQGERDLDDDEDDDDLDDDEDDDDLDDDEDDDDDLDDDLDDDEDDDDDLDDDEDEVEADDDDDGDDEEVLDATDSRSKVPLSDDFDDDDFEEDAPDDGAFENPDFDGDEDDDEDDEDWDDDEDDEDWDDDEDDEDDEDWEEDEDEE